jgi:hypothetical protein
MAPPSKILDKKSKEPDKLTIPAGKRDQNSSIKSPTTYEMESKKTRTTSPVAVTQPLSKNNSPSPPLRKMNILYTNNCQPPFQIILESKNESTPIGKRLNVPLVDFFASKQKFQEGEGFIKKNERQLILEFKTAARANEFIANTDLNPIQGKAYIPPSYVEIVGII